MKNAGFEPPIIQEEYIDISGAFGSSQVENPGASTALNSFVPINKVAEAKGLKSTRAIRLKIQQGQYIAREVTVQGGKSYEILFESLEYDIQALVKENPGPFYYPAIQTKSFVPDTAKTIALARIDLIKQWGIFRIKYQPKYQGDKLMTKECCYGLNINPSIFGVNAFQNIFQLLSPIHLLGCSR